jgi:hypothetical protein
MAGQPVATDRQAVDDVQIVVSRLSTFLWRWCVNHGAPLPRRARASDRSRSTDHDPVVASCAFRPLGIKSIPLLVVRRRLIETIVMRDARPSAGHFAAAIMNLLMRTSYIKR